MSHNKANRILHILQYLQKNTDDEHYVTAANIAEYLSSLGIPAVNRTIIQDIAQLREYGYDIIEQLSTQYRYSIGSRKFELAELKLLVDAVQSARFITNTKSRQLIDKLMSMVSIHQAKELNRSLYVDKRIKPINEMILYVIDTIQSAIMNKQVLVFQYYYYNEKKERVFKHGGLPYYLSPYDLIWNEDSYYVIGFSRSHNQIAKFRVDRIHKPAITGEFPYIYRQIIT